MPIVINDFEIVVERPDAGTTPTPARAAEAEAPALLRPEEITRVLGRHYDRLARVRAT